MAVLGGRSSQLLSRSTKNTLYWAVITVLVFITLVNPIRKLRAGFGSASTVAAVRPPPAVPSKAVVTAPPVTDPDLRDHIRPEDLPRHPHVAGDERSTDAPTAGTRATKPPPALKLPGDAASEGLQRRLLQYLEHRAATKPAKGSACFVSLVRHTDEGLKRLVRLLRNVKEQLPGMAARYPFVAFLEHGVDVAHVKDTIETMAGFKAGTRVGGEYPLAHVFPAGVLLHVLDEEDFGRVPNFLKPEHLWDYRGHNYWGVSYRHMCRFFAVRVMHQRVLDKFDYYMRLDTDSFILAAPRTTTFAPVAHMEWDTSFRFNSLVVDEHATNKPREVHEDGGTVTFNDPVHEWYKNAQGTLLSYLGFAEREEDVDLFHEMSARGSLYGFSMIHPQTQPEFMHGQFEALDSFVRKEAADHHVSVGDPSLGIRKGGEQGPAPSPFNAPRGLGLHFWDNFEIVDLRMFRSKPKTYPLVSVQKRLGEGNKQRGQDDHNDNDNVPIPLSDDERRKHSHRAQIANRFLLHIDRAGGIYYNRWGDAEIRTQTMTLLLGQDQYMYFNSLPYQHYHNFHCPQKRPPYALPSLVPKWNEPPLSNTASEQVRLDVLGKLDESYKDFLGGDQGLIAMHEAVDIVIRVLSPHRANVDDDVRAECTDQARRNYGQGSKGEGSAPMNPAESRANNQFFWNQDWPSM